ncbi:phosphotriesterase family protein [Parasphaerochaeta coccoides]|uniref:Aryldialkylphosphatase n=1 Tax=Parasphaerochaeta coccoides (strain ATCC BAA-1237 / DSM 17374 / SPN1) TaxID=760011 RepID=F4GIU8_PARC1|nr:hydrolase [Parasphaerochaeta coccoides]AEC02716.1 aryldialkylphosphatase [Parasphaerochaeta coccoides DSM 17374]
MNNDVFPCVYAHEHTTIDLSGVKKTDDCRLDEKEQTIAEFSRLRELGVSTIIDMTNKGMGRNVMYVEEVARRTSLNILHGTGYYKEPFLPEEAYELDEPSIAAMMIRELTQGIDDTSVKASFIGEIGTDRNAISDLEKKIFRAASKAHLETGAAIATHTTLGTLGMEQVALFKTMRVDLSHVVISHVDLSGDFEYMVRLMDEGVTIAFDTIGKENYMPDEKRKDWLVTLCARGYSGQIVMSMDITRKSQFKANGGLGYSYLLETFVPLLVEAGINKADLKKMLHDNPKRVYRFEEN